MIDTKLRHNVQPAFDKVASMFVKCHIKADTITVMGFIIGIVSGVMIAFNHLFVSFVLLWISGLFDVLDGTVARLSGTSSKRGAYMDLIFDRMVESAVILGFYFLLPNHAFFYILFFISVLFNFTTFIVAASLFENKGKKSMHYDVGIAERTETFIVFSLMMFFPAYTAWILLTFNFIIFLTGIIRFYRILKSEKVNK